MIYMVCQEIKDYSDHRLLSKVFDVLRQIVHAVVKIVCPDGAHTKWSLQRGVFLIYYWNL